MIRFLKTLKDYALRYALFYLVILCTMYFLFFSGLDRNIWLQSFGRLIHVTQPFSTIAVWLSIIYLLIFYMYLDALLKVDPYISFRQAFIAYSHDMLHFIPLSSCPACHDPHFYKSARFRRLVYENPDRLYAEIFALNGNSKLGIWVDKDKDHIFKQGITKGYDAKTQWDEDKQCWNNDAMITLPSET